MLTDLDRGNDFEFARYDNEQQRCVTLFIIQFGYLDRIKCMKPCIYLPELLRSRRANRSNSNTFSSFTAIIFDFLGQMKAISENRRTANPMR